MCYACPREKYEFVAAVAAKDSAPFFGIWFCGGLDAPAAAAGDPEGERSAALSKYAKASKSVQSDGSVVRATASVAAAQGARAQSKGIDLETKGVNVYASLAALRGAGVVKSREEESARQKANPKQAKLREAGLKQLSEKRKHDADYQVRARERASESAGSVCRVSA